MRAYRIRLLAILALLAVLDPASLGAGPGAELPPAISGITFRQLDWLGSSGAPLRPDSTWGQMTFSYLPGRTTWYLNVAIAHPGSSHQAWLVRNLPLFGERKPTQRRELVYLDLQSLGYTEGEDWKSVQVALKVDRSLRRNAPQAIQGPVISVGSRPMQQTYCLGKSEVEPLNPGRPRPILIQNEPVVVIVPTRSFQPVQEADDHCVAGAFARSLGWLNSEHKFLKNLTAQQAYRDLVKVGVSNPKTPGSPREQMAEWISAKNDYARLVSDEQIVTKVWDGTDVDQIPPIPGVKEEEGDLLAWIQKEMTSGADVEVGYVYSGGKHLVAIVGMFSAGETMYLRFREDQAQGDDKKGDDTITSGEVWKNEDGEYGFFMSEATIGIAISESVKKKEVDVEPAR